MVKSTVLLLENLMGHKTYHKDGCCGKLEPTIFGLGIISSSSLSDTPPNLNSVLLSSLINVVNLYSFSKS